ncbi:MAG: Nicotinate-nucleotide adenylyltransferase [Candidatus Celerinatantimonas neptuna]|nr:MAG: Nicotinate-nucleotide adenylyltransferase [Candidatus Celerinatantimonas neptuna]
MSEPRLYLGGSFDPIHLGHLRSIEQLREQLALEKAFLLPAKISPLKSEPQVSEQARLMMLKLALQDYPHLYIDDQELKRDGKSYTWQTLRQLRDNYPDTPIIFAMGMDSLLSIDRWYHWQQLTDLAHLVIFSRPSYHPQPNCEISHWLSAHQADSIQSLHQNLCGHIWLTQVQPYKISSTALRQSFSNGTFHDYQHLLPSSVYSYIVANSLYDLTIHEKP